MLKAPSRSIDGWYEGEVGRVGEGSVVGGIGLDVEKGGKIERVW